MPARRLPWFRSAPERTVFVLGGGGNLGAVQVGMLSAVLERGIVPDAVVGCSAGALNGVAVAADPSPGAIAVLREVWEESAPTILGSGRLDALRLLRRRTLSLQSNAALRRLLETAFGDRRFEDLAIPLEVVATELDSGAERWWSTGPLIEPILASAALPGVFPPVVIDDVAFIDGGVVNNVPVSRARGLGATRIVVFHVGNFDRPRPAPRRPIDVLLRSLSIARNFRFQLDCQAPVPEGVELLVLPGVDPGKLRYSDFTRSRELIASGHASTAAFLDLAVSAAD